MLTRLEEPAIGAIRKLRKGRMVFIANIRAQSNLVYGTGNFLGGSIGRKELAVFVVQLRFWYHCPRQRHEYIRTLQEVILHYRLIDLNDDVVLVYNVGLSRV